MAIPNYNTSNRVILRCYHVRDCHARIRSLAMTDLLMPYVTAEKPCFSAVTTGAPKNACIIGVNDTTQSRLRGDPVREKKEELAPSLVKTEKPRLSVLIPGPP